MNTKLMYIAGGCFWGMEDLFRVLDGVVDTEVGYTGGVSDNPTYENHPGHAEAIEIEYDPDKITYKQLLDFFFRIHDPTTVNQQGNDIGESYRSAIFFQDETELREAEEIIQVVNDSGYWKQPVATTLEEFDIFYPAEDCHQDYLEKNPGGYTCHFLRTEESFLG